MKAFTAAHHGRCHECGEEIAPGDEVAYADDDLVHEDCHPDLLD